MSRRRRALPSLAAAAVAAIALAGSSEGASSGARFTVELTPRLVVPKLRHVPDGARATLESTILHSRHLARRMVSWSFDLKLSGLTSDVTRVDIRIGKPGRVGALIAHLCGPHPDTPRCGSRVRGFVYTGGSATWTNGATFIRDPRPTLRVYGAYVDVRTRLNPRGELRGDILPSMLLSPGATSARVQLARSSRVTARTASAVFEATIDEGTLTYRLSFSGLSSPVRSARLVLAKTAADHSSYRLLQLCAGSCWSPEEGAVDGELARLVRTHGGRVVIGTEKATAELVGWLTPAMFEKARR